MNFAVLLLKPSDIGYQWKGKNRQKAAATGSN